MVDAGVRVMNRARMPVWRTFENLRNVHSHGASTRIVPKLACSEETIFLYYVDCEAQANHRWLESHQPEKVTTTVGGVAMKSKK